MLLRAYGTWMTAEPLFIPHQKPAASTQRSSVDSIWFSETKRLSILQSTLQFDRYQKKKSWRPGNSNNNDEKEEPDLFIRRISSKSTHFSIVWDSIKVLFDGFYCRRESPFLKNYRLKDKRSSPKRAVRRTNEGWLTGRRRRRKIKRRRNTLRDV